MDSRSFFGQSRTHQRSRGCNISSSSTTRAQFTASSSGSLGTLNPRPTRANQSQYAYGPGVLLQERETVDMLADTGSFSGYDSDSDSDSLSGGEMTDFTSQSTPVRMFPTPPGSSNDAFIGNTSLSSTPTGPFPHCQAQQKRSNAVSMGPDILILLQQQQATL